MHTLKTALAIGFAALLLSTSLASANSTRSPTDTTQTTPSDQHSGPDNNKPFPEFGIDDDVVVSKPVVKINPYVVTCSYWGLHDKIGPEVGFFNKGTNTIPAGSIITLTMPNGTTYEIKLYQDVPPGGGVAIDGPDYADKPGFTCDATITYLSARSL